MHWKLPRCRSVLRPLSFAIANYSTWPARCWGICRSCATSSDSRISANSWRARMLRRSCRGSTPTRPLRFLFTSGTTGAPKGAMLPHRAMTNNVPHAAEIIKAGPIERPAWLATLPMFHLASCVVAAMGTAFLVGTLVTVERFEAGLVLQLVEEERITMMNQVPTLVMAMLNHPSSAERDLGSLHSGHALGELRCRRIWSDSCSPGLGSSRSSATA